MARNDDRDKEYEALKTAREMAAERTRAAMERAAPFFPQTERHVDVDEKDQSSRPL
jgi:hypothetical protein